MKYFMKYFKAKNFMKFYIIKLAVGYDRETP